MDILVRYTCGGRPVPVHSLVVVASDEMAAAQLVLHRFPGSRIVNAVAGMVVQSGVGRYLPGRVERGGVVHFFRVSKDGEINEEPACSTYRHRVTGGFTPALRAVGCPACLHLMEYRRQREDEYQRERGSVGARSMLALFALCLLVLAMIATGFPFSVSVTPAPIPWEQLRYISGLLLRFGSHVVLPLALFSLLPIGLVLVVRWLRAEPLAYRWYRILSWLDWWFRDGRFP